MLTFCKIGNLINLLSFLGKIYFLSVGIFLLKFYQVGKKIADKKR